MIESIPLSALELGIDHERYEELARNIGRMRLINPEKRQRILEDANEKLPKDIFSKAQRLITDLSYDRGVFKIAEIPYHKGPPVGENLFTTAVADYLLRERPFESKTSSE